MSPSVKILEKNLQNYFKNVKHNELNKNSNKQIDMMVILRNLKKKFKKMLSLLERILQKRQKLFTMEKSKERAIYGQADAKRLRRIKK